MKSTKQKFLSLGLILVLSFSIIPMESFHHHDDLTAVCLESSAHIEEDGFECVLADFVLPLFLKGNLKAIFNGPIVLNEMVEWAKMDVYIGVVSKLYLRGPPMPN